MSHISYLIVGTYTSGTSKGIQLYRFDEACAAFQFIEEAEVENPSYLTVSRDGRLIYAVSENEQTPSYLNAFTFDKEKGKISFLNRQETYGAAPCYVELDKRGMHAVTANYAGGNISVFEIDHDGELSEIIQKIDFDGKGKDPERQVAPHIHCVKFSPEGNFLFATDLGTDKVYCLKVIKEGPTYLDEKNIESYDVPAGSGPRHLQFHPSGKYLYLITELTGEVIVFRYENYKLQLIQSEAIDTASGSEAGDIDITPDGKFIYASSRTENDGVAIFTIAGETGNIHKAQYLNTGIHPRNIKVTPNGKYLLIANKNSNAIEFYTIDRETGLLEKTTHEIKVDSPVCIDFI